MSPCGEAEEQAPWSRGAEMPCRSPPLPGEECASARREFRWNHGLIVRPEPKTGSGRFFCPGRRKGEWNMKNTEKTMEKIVEWSDCYLKRGDIVECMERQIEEFCG